MPNSVSVLVASASPVGNAGGDKYSRTPVNRSRSAAIVSRLNRQVVVDVPEKGSEIGGDDWIRRVAKLENSLAGCGHDAPQLHDGATGVRDALQYIRARPPCDPVLQCIEALFHFLDHR